MYLFPCHQVIAHGCKATTISVDGMFCSNTNSWISPSSPLPGLGATGAVSVFDLQHRAWESINIPPPSFLAFLGLYVELAFARLHFIAPEQLLVVAGWSLYVKSTATGSIPGVQDHASRLRAAALMTVVQL